MALYQERTILIVSKFQYTQCIGSRQVKLKPYIGVSHLSGIPFSFPIFYCLKLASQIMYNVNTCNNVQIMHPNANIHETRYFV